MLRCCSLFSQAEFSGLGLLFGLINVSLDSGLTVIAKPLGAMCRQNCAEWHCGPSEQRQQRSVLLTG